MICNPPISILFLKEAEDESLTSFLSYLRSIPHIRLSKLPQLPRDLSSYDIVITCNARHSDTRIDHLTRFVHAGGGWQLFVDLSEGPLPQIFGVQQDALGPVTELRVLFENAEHPLAARLPDAVYLRGAHYLDWIVSLIPERVEAVVGTRHKRVWKDVTNADQERIQVRFSGGKEAEFMHSDISAARKPKWFLLGTEGAIVGNWRDVTSHEFDPDHYYQRHDIPATEMVPDLRVFRRHHSGEVIRINPAIPRRDRYRFHSNLADHLLWGEPIAAPWATRSKW